MYSMYENRTVVLNLDGTKNLLSSVNFNTSLDSLFFNFLNTREGLFVTIFSDLLFLEIFYGYVMKLCAFQ